MCKSCGIDKLPQEYYKSDPNHCKECVKNRVKARYKDKSRDPVWLEAERKRGREKYHRLNYRLTSQPSYDDKKRTITAYKQKYPEKEKARTAAGSLVREPGFTLHHWSYNDMHFKDVIQLTFKNHKKAHRFLLYDQDSKMYRRKDTLELLDTKERHEEYIIDKIKNEDD